MEGSERSDIGSLFHSGQQFRRLHGYPRPYEGRCYCGFIARTDRYEYLQGTLSSPLKKGQVYYISFAITTERNADFSEKRIGIRFSSRRESGQGDFALGTYPQITLDTVKDRTISGDWLIYRTFYKASGGEKFITVGQFIAMENFPNPGPAGYFYLDGIYVGSDPWSDSAGAIKPIPVISDTLVPAPDTNAIVAGKTLVLQNIYFETGKSRILPESFQPLDDIIAQLKVQSSLNVEIIGHTDKHGTAAGNQTLSEQRALAVKNYFISKGIDASRITTSGKGSSEPVGDDDQKNRRVEFRFYE